MEEAFLEFYKTAQKAMKLCPWTALQDRASYAEQLVSEAREVVDAVAEGDDAHLKEELGDLLWDALTLALIAEREGRFSAKEAFESAVEKMNRRKPYLLTGEKVTLEQAEEHWHAAKRAEKK